jgi:cysteinyl-tRNA synthetase
MSFVIKQTIIRLLGVAVVTLSGLACIACDSSSVGRTSGASNARRTMDVSRTVDGERTSSLPWSRVRSWAYWLDNPDLRQLGASPFDLLVIDSSADGSAARAFTAQQIAALRRTEPQRRVVAYLSIGQAESYRGYWQRGWHPGAPDWLGAQDSAWPGNYWVEYWQPAWQALIYRYLDAIIAAGFDGVYLDRVDAYQESYAAGHEEDMVQFVANLARYARARSPLGEDFGIIVQNAEELAAGHLDYVRLVTGIAREEVYVRATDVPTSQAARAQVESYLDLFLQNGRLVLTVDYASRPDLICSAYRLARAKGYVPYVTDVGLDRLRTDPGCR